MDKKFQIFISSTYDDLSAERLAVTKEIINMYEIPAGMEAFPASDSDQFEYIKKVINRCDYYVVIIGGRYGSIAPSGVSYTEMEFDYAHSVGIPILALIHSDPFAKLTGEKIETDQSKRNKLVAFREKARNGRMVRFWADQGELALAAVHAIHHAKNEFPRPGWVRSDQATSEEALATILQQKEEIARLKRDLEGYKPLVIDLVPLESEHDFSYVLTTYDHYGSPQESLQTLRAKWVDIWRIVGPKYMSPDGPSKIRTSVESHYTVRAKPAEIQISMSDEALNLIKLQFIAYGFLELVTGLGETLKITQQGMQALLNVTAIKAAAR